MDVDPNARDKGLKQARAVYRKLKRQLQEEIEKKVNPSRKKTADYLREWLAHREAYGELKLALYKVLIERHVIPEIGSTPLVDLAPRGSNGSGISSSSKANVAKLLWREPCFVKRCKTQ